MAQAMDLNSNNVTTEPQLGPVAARDSRNVPSAIQVHNLCQTNANIP